jgi:hypothetical protein
MVRDMALFHTSRAPDAVTKVSQAMAFLDFMHRGMDDIDEHGRILKAEIARVKRFHPAHYFHDDLAEINQSFYIREFAAQAAEYSLQYMEDADFAATQDNRFPPDIAESLAELQGNPILHEQYLDFLKCRRFRQTLLCHEERDIHYVLKPSSIREFFVGGAITPTGEDAAEWRSPGGARLSSDHPVAKAAFAAIGSAWPARFEFTALLDVVRKETGGAVENVEQVLEKLLWEALTSGLIGPGRMPDASPRGRLKNHAPAHSPAKCCNTGSPS